MKKNKMLRTASALLVLTLLTTSIIGGTFAKYVTTDSGSDAARVAKFGVVATVSGDLFGGAYKAAEDNTIALYDATGTTVKAADSADKVVAPGTENKTGLSLSVTGTPEVSTKAIVGEVVDGAKKYIDSDIYLAVGDYGVMVEYTGVKTAQNIVNYYTKDADGKFTKATALPAEGTAVYELRNAAAVADADYHPLEWYVGGTKVDNQEAVKTQITTTFNGKTGTPDAPLNLNTTVGWAWNFSDTTSGNISAQDRKDTILGDMISAQKGNTAITVVSKDTGADTYIEVEYKTEPAAADAANNIVNAYVKGTTTKVACLTAGFYASITVEQVD